MSDEMNNDTISGGLSLADIAGLSMDEVAEVRFEDLPAMRAIFKLTKGEWNQDVGEKKYLTCRLTAEVVQVGEFNDDRPADEDRFAKAIGKTHSETFFIDPSDVYTGLGRIKAFFVDAGFALPAGEKINVQVDRIVAEGQNFIGDVKKRLKKNSEGEYFTNLHPVASLNNGTEEESA